MLSLDTLTPAVDIFDLFLHVALLVFLILGVVHLSSKKTLGNENWFIKKPRFSGACSIAWRLICIVNAHLLIVWVYQMIELIRIGATGIPFVHAAGFGVEHGINRAPAKYA